MKNVTELEMNLLTEIKEYTEKKFSSNNPMWIYTDAITSDMKRNRGVISSLLQKGIIYLESYQGYDDAICVNKDYFIENEDGTAEFTNINLI
jgi:hypothetical protein